MGTHEELIARALAPRAAAPVVSTEWDGALVVRVGGEEIAAISRDLYDAEEAARKILEALAAAGVIVLAEGE